MKIYLNGNLVEESEARISVFDRGFLYGDGLFETMLAHRGRLFRWAQHLERLQRGASFVRVPLPFHPVELEREAIRLLESNAVTDGVLRLTISRGAGPRGYSVRGAGPSTVLMTTHSLPAEPGRALARWRLATSSVRLVPSDPLGGIKSCSRLPYVVARTEAEAAGADEALLLSTDGHIAEASASNLFWIEDQTILTPPLLAGCLPGITRALLFELGPPLGVRLQEQLAMPARLQSADGVFLTLSTLGVVEVTALDGLALASSPLVRRLFDAYWERVRIETSGA